MLKYILLHDLNTKQINQLLKIVSNIEIMKWIGKGKLWDLDYINKLIKYSNEDYENNYKNVSYFYFCVLIKQTVIGLAGIHPGFGVYKNSLQVLYLLDIKHQNKGYIKFIKDELKKCSEILFKKKIIVIITNRNNLKHIKTLKYNEKLKSFKYLNIWYDVYKL